MPDAHDEIRHTTLSTTAGELLSLLWRVNHEMETFSKHMFRSLGVTGPQRMVLRIVMTHPGISATEICEIARIHPSTLTGIIERLVRGGFVERLRDQTDHRRLTFFLTPKGESIANLQRGTIEAASIASIEALSPKDRAVVLGWLLTFGNTLAKESASITT